MGSNNRKPYLSRRRDNYIRGYLDGTNDALSLVRNSGLGKPGAYLKMAIEKLVDSLYEDFDTFLEGYRKGAEHGLFRGIQDVQDMLDV
jgi:hypothetical protein